MMIAHAPILAQAAKTKPAVNASVAVRVSTLGVGVEGSALVAPNVALRLGYSGYSYSHTQTSQDVMYDGKLKLSSVSALADVYPSQAGTFHVTAGLIFNSNTITAHGKPSSMGGAQTYTLNGMTFSAADVGSLDGRASFSKTAPYFGIGFGKPAGSSPVQFLFDVGVVFQGKPHLSLARNGGINITNPTLNDQINAAINAQRDKTQSDLNKFQYYPVVSVGLAYQF